MHFVDLYFIPLYFIASYFVSLHFTALHFTALRFTALRFISFHRVSLFILSSSLVGPAIALPAYPDHWWTSITDVNTPKWEILPQAASKEKGDVILSKRNELGLLSNFAATPFTMLGIRYASIEGLWQGMKYPESNSEERGRADKSWPHTRSQVFDMTAFKAKDAGKLADVIMKANNISWVSFNGYKMDYKGKDQDAYYEVIEAATRAKIDENEKVKKVLLATGNLKLRPDHYTEPDSRRAWNYFDIHMKLRTELQTNPNKKLYNSDWFKNFAKKYKLIKI